MSHVMMTNRVGERLMVPYVPGPGEPFTGAAGPGEPGHLERPLDRSGTSWPRAERFVAFRRGGRWSPRGR